MIYAVEEVFCLWYTIVYSGVIDAVQYFTEEIEFDDE